MSWNPGWHSTAGSLAPSTPAARSQEPESRSADSIEVVFTHRTAVKGRDGRRVEYRSGDRAYLPESLARAMYASSTLNCTDPAVPRSRGFCRMLNPEGREQRMAKQPTMPWTTLNKILPQGQKPFPASGPKPAMPQPKPEPPVKVPAPVKVPLPSTLK